MKKAITLLIMTLFIVNCTSEKYKAPLIGEWYFEENPSMSLVFTIDTLFLNSTLMTKQNWSINDSNIFFKNRIDYMSNRLEGEEFRSNFYYYLSKNNDTLRWRAKKDTTDRIYKFIRIKNQFEHFQKTIDFKFDLPKSKTNLISIGNDNMDPHYYIGLVNDKLMIKNDIQFIDSKHVFGEVLQLELQLEKKEFENLKIDLFTDRNIPEFKIDSIKKILKRTPIKRIFRVYKNDTINYEKNLNWYGIFE